MDKRLARCIGKSLDGKRKIFFDDVNYDQLIEVIMSEPGLQKKIYYIIELLLNHPAGPTKDLYGSENIERGCEHVKAMKPFSNSNRNMRFYCQHHTDENGAVVIVVVEYLAKKKSQDLKAKYKQIIKKVASYEYDLPKLFNYE